jgi:hypothetical protein
MVSLQTVNLRFRVQVSVGPQIVLLNMVLLAQLVRALVCGIRGHRFNPDITPKMFNPYIKKDFIWCV